MRGAREITGAIFAVLEILHGAMRTFTIDWSNMFQQPDVAISLIGNASWLAFMAFVAAAFRQFSYRWLRAIAAFFAFLFVPIAAVLFFGRYGSPMLSIVPIDWLAKLPAILQIAAHSMQLGVAGFAYLWSVRRERGSLVAASADLAT
jgi:hypothetical protein